MAGTNPTSSLAFKKASVIQIGPNFIALFKNNENHRKKNFSFVSRVNFTSCVKVASRVRTNMTELSSIGIMHSLITEELSHMLFQLSLHYQHHPIVMIFGGSWKICPRNSVEWFLSEGQHNTDLILACLQNPTL